MEINITGSLHIAITGHRFISNEATLQQSIHQVIEEISKEYWKSEIILYSALAEGSDQLVAEIALEYQNIRLYVPLPVTMEEYFKDFYSEKAQEKFQVLLSRASRIEIISECRNHQDAYQALGTYLVGHADILIAVWNGEYNQKKGGTSEVVKAALNVGKMVYWIFCPNQASDADNCLMAQKEVGELQKLKTIG